MGAAAPSGDPPIGDEFAWHVRIFQAGGIKHFLQAGDRSVMEVTPAIAGAFELCSAALRFGQVCGFKRDEPAAPERPADPRETGSALQNDSRSASPAHVKVDGDLTPRTR